MALVATPRLLSTLLAALLGACAGPTGHVQPPPANSATEPLPCVGRSHRAREADSKLGEIDIRTWCERDHLIVERRGAGWAERCLVERAHALAVWDAARRDQVTTALRALPSHEPSIPSRPDPQPVSSDALETNGGSCPCPRAGDLRGEHCWDHPCDPAPLPASAPTSEASDQPMQSRDNAGPFVSRCTTVLHRRPAAPVRIGAPK